MVDEYSDIYTSKTSVRDLVEFILRHGDITISSGLRKKDAMLEGTKIHQKIQRSMGAGYKAEVSLKTDYVIQRKETADSVLPNTVTVFLEGRADGIFTKDDIIYIDEIKGIYTNVNQLKKPDPVHRAQALCYAYIYSVREQLKNIGIRITYCRLPEKIFGKELKNNLKYFDEIISFHELSKWFHELMIKYSKWIFFSADHVVKRNESIKKMNFPFPYRVGQAELVKGIYLSIIREKRLYIQAPTGVGKTISTIYPTLKALGEKKIDTFFYLTAKTITRSVAEDTLTLLLKEELDIKSITLTAKEKICLLDKPKCHPGACPVCTGHFDRINDAVFDCLTKESIITRETVLSYAKKHRVCPFELGLDISLWTDCVIGDYNYAFDPTARLKRFFSDNEKKSYVLLTDEAHNLVDRSREMFSSSLKKEDFLAAKRIAAKYDKSLTSALDGCNREMLAFKRKCDTTLLIKPDETDKLIAKALRCYNRLESFLSDSAFEKRDIPDEEQDILLNLYFNVSGFLETYEILDEKYYIYADYEKPNKDFVIYLRCMDPSTNLDTCLNNMKSAIFFSATFLPINYYKEQLAFRKDDYAIYAPSPFPKENRKIFIANNVSSRYTRRGPDEYKKISIYLRNFVAGKKGNYLIFFPSYKMMEDIGDYFSNDFDDDYNIIFQSNNMSEDERKIFLSNFTRDSKTIGMCVLGGIFSEGIDLPDTRLIGTCIVGTGLPMVCPENELYRSYFEEKKKSGFSYAYLYPGMNKVMQAAGRVIRTATDTGVILLLDERFLTPSYQELFPKEWFPYEVTDENHLLSELKKFWEDQVL